MWLSTYGFIIRCKNYFFEYVLFGSDVDFLFWKFLYKEVKYLFYIIKVSLNSYFRHIGFCYS